MAKITIIWNDSDDGEVVSAAGEVVLSDNEANILMYSQETFEQILKNYARLAGLTLCKCAEG